MFEAINRNVDLADADVLDLGCGYGDLVTLSVTHGARSVTFIDRDVSMVLMTQKKLVKVVPEAVTWQSFVLDINDRSQLDALSYYHVAYCTSVLPYIDNRNMLLSFMATRAEVSIVEMQYYGDGPGPAAIRNDADMAKWLRSFWPLVEKIGKTYTGRNPAYRSIWKCDTGGDSWRGRPRLKLRQLN